MAVGLRQYLHVLRVRWRIVVATTMLGIAVSAGLSWTVPASYSSETTLYLTARVAPGDLAGAYDGAQLAVQKATLYVPLISGPEFAEVVAERAGSTVPDAMRGSITVVAEPETAVLRIVASGVTPQAAQQLAAAASDATVDLVSRVEAPVEPLDLGDAAIVARVAQPPSEAVTSSGPFLGLLLGLIVGFVLGALVALARDANDHTIRDAEELGELIREPLLGSIASDGRADRRLPAGYSARAESFRQLRTSLGFLPGRPAHRVLAVTSPVAREGRTSVTCHLADAIGRTGRSVLVIGSDLRDPRLVDYMNVDGSGGLCSVLRSNARLSAVTRRWPHGPVDVLPAGGAPPDPSELLGSRAMYQLLQTLRSRYDVVLLDTPPILSVTDAAVVAALADATILVVGRGRSTRADVERAAAVLRRAGRPVLGSVLMPEAAAHPVSVSPRPSGTPQPGPAPRLVGAWQQPPHAPSGRSGPVVADPSGEPPVEPAGRAGADVDGAAPPEVLDGAAPAQAVAEGRASVLEEERPDQERLADVPGAARDGR